MHPVTFSALGSSGFDKIRWRAPGGDPEDGHGGTFKTTWTTTGKKTVTATCGGTKKKTTVLVVDVEIQINNTDQTNDDIVQVKSDHPQNDFSVPCQIKLIGVDSANARAKVRLLNSDDRLAFDLQAPDELELSARRWQKFTIYGHKASKKIGDAKILVQVIGDEFGANLDIVAVQNVTVFSFDQAEIRVKKAGKYVLKDNQYLPLSPSESATFSSKARLRPAGLDCDAPQIKNLRVGIMQEMSPPDYLVTATWDTPTIKWNAGVKKGATVIAPKSVRVETRLEGPGSGRPLNFSIIGKAAPLWDDAAAALKPPEGCANAGAATSNHSEAILPERPFWIYQKGRVRWNNLVKATIKANFRAFCVVFDTETKHFCALRQQEWELRVNSKGPPADQHAVVYPQDDVSSDPAKPAKPGDLRYSDVMFDHPTAIVTFTKK